MNDYIVIALTFIITSALLGKLLKMMKKSGYTPANKNWPPYYVMVMFLLVGVGAVTGILVSNSPILTGVLANVVMLAIVGTALTGKRSVLKIMNVLSVRRSRRIRREAARAINSSRSRNKTRVPMTIVD